MVTKITSTQRQISTKQEALNTVFLDLVLQATDIVPFKLKSDKSLVR